MGDALHASRSLERSLDDHAAAVHAGTRPHLDEMVRGADGVLVVLDHDQRIADVAETLERGDHLDVVLGMQADAGLVEHVQHAHQARSNLRGQPDALGLAAGQRAGSTVEIQVVEADPQEQRQPSADFLEDVPAGVGAAPGRLDGAEKRVELVEVHLPDVVEGAAADGEEQPRGAQPGALAVGTDLLDHHLVEPRFHPRVRLSPLPVVAIVALDAPGDAVEADLASFPVVATDLGVGRRVQHDLPRLDAVEDRRPCRARAADSTGNPAGSRAPRPG